MNQQLTEEKKKFGDLRTIKNFQLVAKFLLPKDFHELRGE